MEVLLKIGVNAGKVVDMLPIAARGLIERGAAVDVNRMESLLPEVAAPVMVAEVRTLTPRAPRRKAAHAD